MATWMDLEIIILSEVSQRQHHTVHLHMETKKITKLTEKVDQKSGCQGLIGRGNREMLFKKIQIVTYKINKI